MATFITDITNDVEAVVMGVAQNAFTDFVAQLQPVVVAGGTLIVIFYGINMIKQFVPTNMSSFIFVLLRYTVISSIVLVWGNFELILNGIIGLRDAVSATLLNQVALGGGDVNRRMDQLSTNIFTFADESKSTGWFSIDLTAVIVWCLASIMTAVAVLIRIIAMIGLAISIAIAPIAIIMLLFDGTKQLFESWARFAIGFIMIDIVLSGILGIIIASAAAMAGAAGSNTLEAATGFLIICFCATIIMSQIPTMASALTGAIVATATYGQFANAARSGLNTTRSSIQGARNVSGSVSRTVQTQQHAIRQARNANGGLPALAGAYASGLSEVRAAGNIAGRQFTEQSARRGYRTTPQQQKIARHQGRTDFIEQHKPGSSNRTPNSPESRDEMRERISKRAIERQAANTNRPSEVTQQQRLAEHHTLNQISNNVGNDGEKT